MILKSSFQILAALLSKCYIEQLVGLWLGPKRFSTSVWHVFDSLSQTTIFFVIAFLMALGFLLGVFTISFALPIDLYKSLWNSESG